MLVAYLMKIHPELKFPAAMIPRLNGVLTFCRFQNLKKEAHLCRLGKLFAARDIPFVEMQGGAMKVYRPDFPRWMADIDIMVPEDKYASAVDIATSSGYSSAMFTSHSVDVSLPDSEESLLDIHCHLEMMTGKEAAFNEGLFSRASEVNVFSVRGLLPCPEDMVFISLVNLFKNISKKSSEESCLTSFYDLQYLVGLKKDFDWELILENARLTASEFQTYVSSLHISRVLPGLLPDSFMNPGSLGKKRIERGAVDFIFRRNITSGARDQVMGTEAGKSLQKDWNLKVSMWVSLVGFVKLLFSMYWLRLLVLKYRYLFLGKNKPYTK
jgi:hypothetical protein